VGIELYNACMVNRALSANSIIHTIRFTVQYLVLIIYRSSITEPPLLICANAQAHDSWYQVFDWGLLGL
jgi:hypothetical protein